MDKSLDFEKKVSRNYTFSLSFFISVIDFQEFETKFCFFFWISRFLRSLHYNKINKNVYIITRSTKVHQFKTVHPLMQSVNNRSLHCQMLVFEHTFVQLSWTTAKVITDEGKFWTLHPIILFLLLFDIFSKIFLISAVRFHLELIEAISFLCEPPWWNNPTR